MPYPSNWPQHCPPVEAAAAPHPLYRVVKTNPPTASDFLSQAELGRMPKIDPCLRVGISMMKTIEDAAHHRKLFPRAGSYIARITLTPEQGRIQDTPTGKFPSHATWWCPDGVSRENTFAGMVENDEF